ncbi:cytochrome C554 and C-prime [Leptospira langatensis]|uniref:Cytochrome C554 and C-prime n=1 Tax=Leptospira langatensis TaxID=2484983 RepID=A0A5F1ZU26_9LEPT|nr:multiheme c-type cytochrome [Leptospira langatensis]TGJ98962.1 cytochrome C554 and C-prime [Leptospira langatensis]TGL40469.1 cytochrome C554 and C-prime [Leptospira langatensis]
MRRIILLFGTAFFAVLFFLIACKKEDFYQRHWVFPLESQGSLTQEPDPANCGTCHPRQYGSWKATLHSRALGPGFLWQLPKLGKHSSENCFNCHASNPEVKVAWYKRLGWEKVGASVWETGIKEQGVQCFSCHFRKGKVYGPPRREGANSIFQNSNAPHGGFSAQKEFEESTFCKACHQSPETGRRINGKLLMDVYGQWKSSEFSGQKTQCQNCHMPDRDHEWKGISDPEMVRKGIQASLDFFPKGEGAEFIATLKNLGVGHSFPTYSVPKVYLEINARDRNGVSLKRNHSVIGWMLDLELQNEIFDTRLSPGSSTALRVHLSKEEFEQIKDVQFIVRVDPKEYYKRMFEDNWKARDNFRKEAKSWVLPYLQKALQEVNSAEYELLHLEWRPGS